jgi:hypothetical protein
MAGWLRLGQMGLYLVQGKELLHQDLFGSTKTGGLGCEQTVR